jgi:hypothetical protein
VAERVIAADSCRLWIAWAKRASPLAGDVTETLVRASALGAGLVDYKWRQSMTIGRDCSSRPAGPAKEEGELEALINRRLMECA